ncbi:MAG: hypothetical protein [Circular genetic element sp.]|nr:MAG: hypothetical protein [Circular genetic element sp.]
MHTKTLTFHTTSDGNFVIDIARELSKMNRKLVRQGRCFSISGIEILNQGGEGSTRISTLPQNWITRNAYVKAKALWNEMNQLVLEDNQSIKPKWHDFKVQFSTIYQNNLNCVDADLLDIDYTDATGASTGEWEYSSYVLPQHRVDGGGFPLPAEKWEACMTGGDVINPSGGKKNLLLAYQNSRATVFQNDPNVPAQMSLSFYNLLTDSGSQEPELADVLEDQNDRPPYNLTNYPGATVPGYADFQLGAAQAYIQTTLMEPRALIRGFKAPLGLLLVQNTGDSCIMTIHLKEGNYCGVHAPAMEDM